MSFKEIIDALAKNGYDGYLQEKLGFIFCSVLDEAGEPKLETISKISIRSGKYVHSYYNGSIEIDKPLDSLEDLIALLKKKYPIN